MFSSTNILKFAAIGTLIVIFVFAFIGHPIGANHFDHFLACSSYNVPNCPE